MKKAFERRIDSDSENILRKCVGRQINSILAGGFEVSTVYRRIQSTDVSIPVDDESYLIIGNDWYETPIHAVNFFQLSMRLSDHPKDIETKKILEGVKKTRPQVAFDTDLENMLASKKGLMLYPNHSQLHLRERAPIKSIAILERSCEEEKESVVYDCGVMFTMSTSERICIVVQDSIAGLFEISFSDEDVDAVLRECNVKEIEN